MTTDTEYIAWFADLGRDDVERVGGKNASLGEMLTALRASGIRVPDGFATTAAAYRAFLDANGLRDRIAGRIAEFERGDRSLSSTGKSIRRMIRAGDFPPAMAEAVTRAYADLSAAAGKQRVDIAARSSATAEDLPEASFAGQQETFLNVRGGEAVLDACRRCFASLFTNRAIAYRDDHGFDHMKVALSVGVQRMVRADKGGSGVMFSIDTETGFPHVVLIDAAWGLGETVVQGSVDPDEYVAFKPLLGDDGLVPIVQKRLGGKERKLVYAAKGAKTTRMTDTSKKERTTFVLDDAEIVRLARWAAAIEEHYGRPMDMEWAKDGDDGELYVVQARPETVQSRREGGSFRSFTVRDKGKRLVAGLSVGNAAATGPVVRLDSPSQGDRFDDDAILVTTMTDPDWVPIMQRAGAIVTDHGGRTSHAAIVSRELGLPAVVGTEDATDVLDDGMDVTVSCAEGDEGFVYEGIADVDVREIPLEEIPDTRTDVQLNLANPAAALRWWRLPSDGVGLARMEFIIDTLIKVHPLALSRFDDLDDDRVRRRIDALAAGHGDRTAFFVDTLAHGIGRIAASQHPHPVIVRMSDFKTNEYADLIGGSAFEPEEANPMLGWRGASRYYSEHYRDGFALECRAIRKVREEIGLTNVVVMIPFCRTLGEADRVLETLADNGLVRGEHGLEVYVMCEIPSNVILADGFAERFDGFSIGSNDLTQLVLGVDRDAARLAHLYDETNAAVTGVIEEVIRSAHRHRRKVGFCGQAPSDRPEFAAFLVRAGIDSISVAPDSFLEVKRHVARAERETAG
jgi:pyruvate,water dikinase